MKCGIPKESKSGERRIASSPDVLKKFLKKGLQILVETDAGSSAQFPDESFRTVGAQMASRQDVWAPEIVIKINRPTSEEIALLKSGALLICLAEPYRDDGFLQDLAAKNISLMALELIPRTSRAQSMDVLSSQANIAGYRAVLEAAHAYGRFFPMMMTSAGMAKPAKAIVLGAGVAGLQAIATARRLGAQVETFDVRPEVKEQIQSLGAKFIELNIGEEGTGQGGYARELSEEGKRKQQLALTERLKGADIVISTANIPGRKAPVLITEDAVKGMRPGSVIVDMAAANGGNCPLSVADQIVVKNGVSLIGFTNLPALMPTDVSQFFGNSIFQLLSLVLKGEPNQVSPNLDLNDDIVAGCLAVTGGQVRWKRA